MDQQLDDTLNLENAMTTMDFDHSGQVVSQEDITLEASHEGEIPMEFEQMEEQPMLMDTGNEIIVSDFMNDQYTLQEYSIQDDQIIEASGSVQENQELDVMTSHSETMVDLNFEPAVITQNVPKLVSTAPKVITVKASQANRPVRKPEFAAATMPKHIAIAPKPSKPVPIPKTYGKHLPIAPKPVALVVNKSSVGQKTSVLPSTVKANTVLTQIGKQFVMIPGNSSQKIKLMPSTSGSIQYVRASNDQQAQFISAKSVIGTNQQKPMLTQVILQPENQSDQPAVITKLTQSGASSAGNQKRYIMQSKSVPFNMARSKVILTSPTKVPLSLPQKKLVPLKSPQKLTAVTSQASSSITKKVMITSNPNHNVILKTTAPSKTAQVSKDGTVLVQAQRSQLHQIHVPGKGIQYIRLITNSSPAALKPAAKATPLSISNKKFVLTDGKGNSFQMTADKITSSQPPPLVLSGNVGTKLTSMAAKPQKLVRIAPATLAPATTKVSVQQSTRPLQSLLAPLSPVEEPNSRLELEEIPLDQHVIFATGHQRETVKVEIDADVPVEEQVDSKAALKTLLEQAAEEDSFSGVNVNEVEVDCERQEHSDEDSSSTDQPESGHRPDSHPLIVVPSNLQGKYESQVRVTSDSSMLLNESNYSNVEVNYSNVESNYTNTESSYSNAEANYNVESDVLVPFLSPRDNNGDMTGTLPGLRPRKACNCTKSQCLKLYCDCFANGEFCNQCNCINCHNNLENEELRQKAIRACLIRNPNAFRPKIGKTKTGGPELIRRHTKGCNCKRSGCLKNYCECYEAKIACTAMCKCVGCRNVEETLERRRDALRRRDARPDHSRRAVARVLPAKQPCSFMTSEVIEAVCQCLIASAAEGNAETEERFVEEPDPVRDVIEEFARCLQDIIGASHQSGALSPMHQGHA